MSKKHTILGASGVIGRTLTARLKEHGETVRLVDRKLPDGADGVTADLLDLSQVRRAVEGSDVVHFTVGLPFDDVVWAEQFPAILRNVVAALERTTTRLVFMDNVYMYGKVSGSMTEDQPHVAETTKGRARKRLIEELQASGLDFVVARSADFYGPGADSTSLLNLFVLQNLKAGRPASWLGGLDHQHSFTYTRDIAAAMVHLASAAEVSRTTWHVPTVRPPETIRELAVRASRLGGYAQPSFQVSDLAAVRSYAKENTVMAATIEMFYQFDSDYVFDSSRYEARFGVRPTPIDRGLEETIAALP